MRWDHEEHTAVAAAGAAVVAARIVVAAAVAARMAPAAEGGTARRYEPQGRPVDQSILADPADYSRHRPQIELPAVRAGSHHAQADHSCRAAAEGQSPLGEHRGRVAAVAGAVNSPDRVGNAVVRRVEDSLNRLEEGTGRTDVTCLPLDSMCFPPISAFPSCSSFLPSPLLSQSRISLSTGGAEDEDVVKVKTVDMLSK